MKAHSPSSGLPWDAYVASLIVSLIGIIVAAPYMPLQLTGFSLIMVVAGTLGSMGIRRRHWPRLYVSWTVGALFLLTALAYWLGVVSAGGRSIGLLWQSSLGGLDWLITWVVVVVAFRSWVLLNDQDVALTVLPTMSLFVLVCIVDHRPFLLAMAVPYGLASLYLGMRYHRGLLEDQVDEVFHTRSRRQESVQNLKVMAGMAIMVGVSAVLLSRLLADMQAPRHWVDRYGVWLASRLSHYLTQVARRDVNTLEDSLTVGVSYGSTSNRPLFEVRSDQEALWRSNVFTYYDGSTWHSRIGKRPPRGSSLRLRGREYRLPREQGEPELPGRKVVQRFTLLVEQSGTFVCAYRPYLLQAPVSMVFLKEMGTLIHPHSLLPRQSYLVVSWVKAMPISQLRKARGTIPPYIRRIYLQLPEDLPESVRRLAHRLASRADNPYDRVQAFIHYLTATHTYNRRAPAFPAGREATEQFLFHMKEGYCQHFASALAVLCRAAGIPSRVVTGFAGGEYDAERETTVVRERDAHAWVDVYLAGAGWVEFDPTSLAQETPRFWRDLLRQLPNYWQQGLAAVRAWWAIHRRSAPRLLAYGSVLLLAGGAGVMAWRRHRARRAAQGARLRRALHPHRQRLRCLYQQGLRQLARQGLQRGATETALEFCQRVMEWDTELGKTWGAFTHLYLQGCYGPLPLDPQEHQQAIGWLAVVRQQLSGRRR